MTPPRLLLLASLLLLCNACRHAHTGSVPGPAAGIHCAYHVQGDLKTTCTITLVGIPPSLWPPQKGDTEAWLVGTPEGTRWLHLLAMTGVEGNTPAGQPANSPFLGPVWENQSKWDHFALALAILLSESPDFEVQYRQGVLTARAAPGRILDPKRLPVPMDLNHLTLLWYGPPPSGNACRVTADPTGGWTRLEWDADTLRKKGFELEWRAER